MSNKASKLIRLIAFTILAMVATTFSTVPAFAGTGEQFTVQLSGDQVVPGPGDPDGSAGVLVATGKKSGTFCFFADTANVATPLTAVDLHQGPRGEVGPVVAELHGPANDPDVSGCVDLGRDRIKDINKNRANYYIDIHNEEFPGGALRGQLG